MFLYQLEQGQAGKSYGLNVAALAGLHPAILKLAAKKSRELEAKCNAQNTYKQSCQQRREEAVKTIVSLVQQQQQQGGSLDIETVIHIAKQVIQVS